MGDGQAEKDESHDVKPVNCLHKPQIATRKRQASNLAALQRHLALLSSSGGRMLTGVQKAEPLYEVRVWVSESLRAWIHAEAKRRELAPSAYIRSHFAAVKERQERPAA